MTTIEREITKKVVVEAVLRKIEGYGEPEQNITVSILKAILQEVISDACDNLEYFHNQTNY